MKHGPSPTADRSAIGNAANSGWDFGPFLQIVSACFEAPCLVVEFENGDVVRIRPEQVAGPVVADWTKVSVYDGMFLSAPGPERAVEIAGSHIREMTNLEYGRFIDWSYRYSAVSIGQKIHSLRVRRGLTGRELARRIGMYPQNLSRIEHGQREPGITTVAAILAALGGDWCDLSISDGDLRTYSADSHEPVSQSSR